MPESPVGKVEHYYPKVKAAAVRLSKRVKVGDKVHIVGHGDDFTEKVTSLQLDHEPIQEGAPGQSVGLWVKERVHKGDDVLLVTPEPTWSKPGPASKAKPKSKAKAKPARKATRASSRRAKPAKKAQARKPSRKASKRKAAGKRRKATKRRPSKKKR